MTHAQKRHCCQINFNTDSISPLTIQLSIGNNVLLPKICKFYNKILFKMI